MSKAVAKAITPSVHLRAYTSYRPYPVPRPRPKTPADDEPGIWIEIPPRRRKLTEAEALAAWDALPEAGSSPLPKDIYEPFFVPHRTPMRIVRREHFDPRRHNGDPHRLHDTDETWVTLWPSDWLRLGAPRP